MTVPVDCLIQHISKGDDITRKFANGCNGKLTNIDTYDVFSERPVFLWGILRRCDLILRHHIDNNHDYYYGDNNYFYNGHYFRMTKNNLQNNTIVERPDDRFNQMKIDIAPWTKDGRHILLCPPSNSFGIFFDQKEWIEETTAELRKYTDREIRVRYKPSDVLIDMSNGYMDNGGMIKRNIVQKSIDEDLSDCWAVAAFQSNVTILATQKGIPTFVPNLNAASVLGNVELKNIESPVYNDQQAFFNHLAYCQFTLDEINNGTAWNIISENLPT